MKKASLQSLVNFFDTTVTVDVPQHIKDICDEMRAELAKGEEKAQANRDLYASAHDVVMKGLRAIGKPVPISKLYDKIAAELPDNFSKGKLQYAITRLWANEVIKTEGKVNAYSVKE